MKTVKKAIHISFACESTPAVIRHEMELRYVRSEITFTDHDRFAKLNRKNQKLLHDYLQRIENELRILNQALAEV